MTLAFKAGTGGCGSWGGWILSEFFGDCCGRSGLSGVYPPIFVLHLNDLPSEAF